MKRNYLLTVLVLFVVASLLSCGTSSKDRKARSVVRNEIKASLDEDSRYEQVSFSVIDSVLTTPLEIEAYKELYKEFAHYDKLAKERMRARESHQGIDEDWAISRRNLYLAQAKEFQDSARMLKPALDSIAEGFVPEFAGWSMTHTYRIIRGREESVWRKRFILDPELTKVIEETEISVD